MEKTKDLKNKKLVRRLIQLSQPKKDISKTFKVDDDEDKVKYTTEEVDDLGLDEVIEELEQWLEEKESNGEKVEVEDEDEDVMDFLNKIDFDYLVKLK